MTKSYSVVLALFVLSSGLALAQVPAPIVTPQSGNGFAPVVAGDTRVEIPIKVDHYDTMFFRVTVTVDGASMALVNPSGAVAVAANSPLIQFKPGPQSDDGQPRIFNMFKSGGEFTTENIPTPTNGVWKLRLTFPPAKEKGFTSVIWSAKSAYESGMRANDTSYLIGETGLFDYLVTNKQKPIMGLSPTIMFTSVDARTLKPVGGSVSQAGKEGGDGLYSVEHIFTSAGKHQVTGSVIIPTSSGNISRTATTWVEVIKPSISLVKSSVTPRMDAARNCAIGINAGLTLDVSVAGDYIIRADLKGSNGKVFSVGDSFTLASGTESVSLLFPIGLIKEKIGTSPSYAVTGVHGYKIAPTAATVRAFDVSNLGVYAGSLSCR